MTKLGWQKLHICPKVTKLCRVYNWPQNRLQWGRGSDRPVEHTQQKLTQVTLPPCFSSLPPELPSVHVTTPLPSNIRTIILFTPRQSCFWPYLLQIWPRSRMARRPKVKSRHLFLLILGLAQLILKVPVKTPQHYSKDTMNDIPDILLNSRSGGSFAVGDVGVTFTVWASRAALYSTWCSKACRCSSSLKYISA